MKRRLMDLPVLHRLALWVGSCGSMSLLLYLLGGH